MKVSLKISIIVLLLALAGLAWTGTALASDKALKVLVLPFKINAAQDLTYIQEGILDMISSRLAWEGKVAVVERVLARQAFEQAQGKIDDKTAIELGRKAEADYVLYGSLTVIGQNISLDSKILSQVEKKPALTVHAQAESMDGVIPKINSFVEDINDKIFKRKAQPRYAEPKKEAPAASRRHPESLLIRSGDQGVFSSSAAYPKGEGFWRSPSIRVPITGLDIGDIDGDNKNEIVYSSFNKVFVGRFEDGRFRRLAQFDGYVNDRCVTLDVADINGNGLAEIFVSNRINDKASSYVLEYVNGRLAPIVKDSPWYYRVINLPSGRILVGQESTADKMFYGPVYRMDPKGNEYVPREPLSLPREKVNIFNFGVIRFAGQTSDSLVYVDKYETLHIKVLGGESLWDGDERFGGSVHYLAAPLEDGDKNMRFEDKYYYIPPRILSVDSNGDGRQEILIARAKRSGLTDFVRSLRPLQSGSVFSLSFSQMSLRENWRSPVLAGYPVDYQIKDYDNDGSPDLVIGVLIKSGESVLSKARSVVVAYSLKSLQEESNTGR
ncbi:MAG: VCBS repeat-containing protein [Deltaproteobacteria bacterium]|nr:VCBS repeat-containing protein [Deltaproteobacteria bacterium]MBW2053838.1 VCBS repeat-containing protein [Deltaproteobacteria bacterium]MBW2142289.1 VCBS repeat-containing protein [Deltaproteobacteria bacterium]MBW2324548.1 VCBS repeat-containing protein [Deltaproteobacteria bacterium]